MTPELTREERLLLNEILLEYHRQLQQEIFHTDHKEFKAKLRHKEQLVETLMRKLEVHEAAAA